MLTKCTNMYIYQSLCYLRFKPSTLQCLLHTNTMLLSYHGQRICAGRVSYSRITWAFGAQQSMDMYSASLKRHRWSNDSAIFHAEKVFLVAYTPGCTSVCRGAVHVSNHGCVHVRIRIYLNFKPRCICNLLLPAQQVLRETRTRLTVIVSTMQKSGACDARCSHV